MIQHADDLHMGVLDPKGLSDTVAAPEQALVQPGRDDRDAAATLVILGRPGAAILKGHLEHGEEVRRGRDRRSHQRRHPGQIRTELQRIDHHHGLAVRLAG